ncbi:MAG: hypothetical protein PHY73_00785 [Candidatus Omnitrophica bacterium]|nr:hypothetical protein [Candidatus Omnitrophota bacterium]
MKRIKFGNIIKIVLLIVFVFLGFHGYSFFQRAILREQALRKVISRLNADSRIAEVLVTGVNFDEKSNKVLTTIKFLEYDSKARPLEPKYFTFSGNIIQFQSLVIRFDDKFVEAKDSLKGKSIFLFWKVFMLDGKDTQEYEITKMNEVPRGYKLDDNIDSFEEKIWEKFWEYALNKDKSSKMGIKNAQIEAPGTMFMPGNIYTLKIEHDGGIRIDVLSIPKVLQGEKIL